MIRITPPAFGAKEVFEHCISAKIKEATKNRLILLVDQIDESDAEYNTLGETSQLFTSAEIAIPPGTVLLEIVNVYVNRFQPPDSMGRKYYDLVMECAANGRCPFCLIGTVSELDHYLPKQRFWTYVVTPRNLIPSCERCNKSKLEHVATTFEEQTIHPYYDDFQQRTWLTANIVEAAPPGVVYDVTNIDGWDDAQISRATTHFGVHGLAELYASNAANELSDNALRFHELHKASGADGIRDYLTNELRYIMLRNHWKGALYRALAESDWFCEHGFSLI